MNKRILSFILLVMLVCLALSPFPAAAAVNVDATYDGGVVTVAGTGFTAGTGYTVRVVDAGSSSVKAMGQVTATGGSGSFSAPITTGRLEPLSDYVVYVNNSDGTLAGSDTSIETASIPTYTATIEAGTGGRITAGTSGSYAAGTVITVGASADNGYTFSVWTSSGGGTFVDAHSTSTTFVMPAANVTITANFISSGGGVTTPTPTPAATATPTDTPAATSTPTSTQAPAATATPAPTAAPQLSAPGYIAAEPSLDSDGAAKAAVKAEAIRDAFADAKADENGLKTVKIEVKAVTGADRYVLELPPAAVASGEAAQRVEIATPEGTVVVPGNMFRPEELPEGARVDISIGIADVSALSDAVKAEIGGRPVIELNVKVNGEALAWDNPDAPVTVSVDYTPTAEELKDPEHIVVWYIDGNGRANAVPNGKYDPATGKVTFTTTHFSKYAVAFVQRTFADISASWAKRQIEVLASKGIINGTTPTTYSPKQKITRADFVTLLVRGLGLTAGISGGFDDVRASDYYHDAVCIARELGITAGVGKNLFDPKAHITREDMMVMAARAMKAAGKLKGDGDLSRLDRFADGASVSSYARAGVAALIENGIIEGNGNRINPGGNATREEIAAVIYRIYNKP